ncbi:MAG: lysophospholipid acyltransferase family protein [Planctomycetota bacterium]
MSRLQPLLFWSIDYAILLFTTLFYRVRYLRKDRVPKQGAVIIVANHQSHLDPPLIGGGILHRQTHYLARVTLFSGFFGKVIRAVNAIPITPGESDMPAIREALTRLGDGKAVVIFAEGARTPDGALKPFKRGTWLLIKKGGCVVVPAAIEGCFDAWPRGQKLPSLLGKRVACAFGEPIESRELIELGADGAICALEERVETLRLELRTMLRSASAGRYPAPGPGDDRAAWLNTPHPQPEPDA